MKFNVTKICFSELSERKQEYFQKIKIGVSTAGYNWAETDKDVSVEFGNCKILFRYYTLVLFYFLDVSMLGVIIFLIIQPEKHMQISDHASTFYNSGTNSREAGGVS